MIKLIFWGSAALLVALTLGACNDKLNVRQAYGFELTTWPLPEEITKGDSVEIRFTLTREGDFSGAEYFIGYVQIKGQGEVTDNAGTQLINREFHALTDMAGLDRINPLRQVFTLWYRNLSDKNAELRFTVRDNFGQEAQVEMAVNSTATSTK